MATSAGKRPRSSHPTRIISIVRDVVLLVIGTAGVLHQEFIREDSDPALLFFYAAIFGLTAFLPGGIADGIRLAQRAVEPNGETATRTGAAE